MTSRWFNRIAWLKVAATIASLFATGCIPAAPPQPSPSPQAVPVARVELVVSGQGNVNVGGDATITAKPAEATAGERCACGCGQEGCQCSARGNAGKTQSSANTSATRSGPQVLPPLKLSDAKPAVELLTQFDDGQCGACDLAWHDWLTNGSEWKFRLVKRRVVDPGGTSPTFRFPNGRVWRPAFYRIGDLKTEFSK